MHKKEIEELPLGFLFKNIQPLGEGDGAGSGVPH